MRGSHHLTTHVQHRIPVKTGNKKWNKDVLNIQYIIVHSVSACPCFMTLITTELFTLSCNINHFEILDLEAQTFPI